MRHEMRARAITACLLLTAFGGGCGGAEEPSDLPGDYSEIIASETDCEQLQAIFDTAEGGGLPDVMVAADERMSEVDC